MDLVKMLKEQLNVDESQAKGGAGLIFNLVKEKLSEAQFSEVEQQVPDIQGMMEAAPGTDGDDAGDGGLMGMIGGLLGGSGGLGKLGELAKLVGGFKKLGLSAESVTNFIPVVLKYVEANGGEAVKKIIASVLTSK